MNEYSTTLQTVTAAPTEKSVISLIAFKQDRCFDEIFFEHVGFSRGVIEIWCQSFDTHVIILRVDDITSAIIIDKNVEIS